MATIKIDIHDNRVLRHKGEVHELKKGTLGMAIEQELLDHPFMQHLLDTGAITVTGKNNKIVSKADAKEIKKIKDQAEAEAEAIITAAKEEAEKIVAAAKDQAEAMLLANASQK